MFRAGFAVLEIGFVGQEQAARTGIHLWRGLTIGQVRTAIAAKLIPVHKQPGKSTVYAFKSEIIAKMKATPGYFISA